MTFPNCEESCKKYIIKLIKDDNELCIFTTTDGNTEITHKQDILSDKDVTIIIYGNEERIDAILTGNRIKVYETMMVLATELGIHIGQSLEDINNVVRVVYDRKLRSEHE